MAAAAGGRISTPAATGRRGLRCRHRNGARGEDRARLPRLAAAVDEPFHRNAAVKPCGKFSRSQDHAQVVAKHRQRCRGTRRPPRSRGDDAKEKLAMTTYAKSTRRLDLRLRHAIGRWHARVEERRALALMDHRELRDSGLSPDEARAEALKPFRSGLTPPRHEARARRPNQCTGC
ncbi:DUF1127 domain-containing protein [Falsiroseomonas sp. HW251]|uniref:DUF1127 domain-containing protein n=1 Tax=Falsiroseomonas sp. HW251 TaxID=3390998 RepID=UPI003D320843